MERKEYRFFAFISYSRADEKWAGWLQRRLETYRFPIALRREVPTLPARLFPIFRDKTDLSGGLLWDELKRQLDESEYLIVICSPHSARSEWVNQEIGYFRTLGRPQNIIPVIVDGTPYSADAARECFCPVLREDKENEVLGVNVAESGRKNAVLRIVAAMTHLQFDQLAKRDRRRTRNRRITAAVLALLLAVAAAAGARQWRTAQAYAQIDGRISEIRDHIRNEEMISALRGMAELDAAYPAARYAGYVRQQMGNLYLKAELRPAFSGVEKARTAGEYLDFTTDREHLIAYRVPEDGVLEAEIFDLQLRPVRQYTLRDEAFTKPAVFAAATDRALWFACHADSAALDVITPQQKKTYDENGTLLDAQQNPALPQAAGGPEQYRVETVLNQETCAGLDTLFEWNDCYFTPDLAYIIGLRNNGVYNTDVEIIDRADRAQEDLAVQCRIGNNPGMIALDYTFYESDGIVLISNGGAQNRLIISGFRIPEEGPFASDFWSYTLEAEQDEWTPAVLGHENGMVYFLMDYLDDTLPNEIGMITVRDCSLAADAARAAVPAASPEPDRNDLIPPEDRESFSGLSVAEYTYEGAGGLNVSAEGIPNRIGYDPQDYTGVDIVVTVTDRDTGEQLIRLTAPDMDAYPYYNDADRVLGFVRYSGGAAACAYRLPAYDELLELLRAGPADEGGGP